MKPCPQGGSRGVAVAVGFAALLIVLRCQGNAWSSVSSVNSVLRTEKQHVRYVHRLPVPPNFDHGIYTLTRGRPFCSVSKFTGLLPEGNWSVMMPLIWKLAHGGNVKIMVFGGSFTAGVNCLQPAETNLSRKLCAWPARFVRWLQVAFPRSTVHLENKALGGTPSGAVLASLGLFNFSGVDLVLVETLINDIGDDVFDRKFGNNIDRIDFEATRSAAYEMLLRTLHDMAPSSLIFTVEAGCPKCNRSLVSHKQILDFYRVPHLDMVKLVQQQPGLWAILEKDPNHPFFESHQAVADLLALSWSSVWDRMMDLELDQNDLTQVKQDFTEFFHTAERRERFGACTKPCAVFSAVKTGLSSAVQPRIQGDWQLVEDRPDKPGWISTVPGSVMEIPLCFGARPSFSLTYLRSYEKLGMAKVTLNGTWMLILGLWEDGSRYSQSDTIFAKAGGKVSQGGGEGGGREIAFDVRPNSTLTMRIENFQVGASGNPKMKLISVISC